MSETSFLCEIKFFDMKSLSEKKIIGKIASETEYNEWLVIYDAKDEPYPPVHRSSIIFLGIYRDVEWIILPEKEENNQISSPTVYV